MVTLRATPISAKGRAPKMGWRQRASQIQASRAAPRPRGNHKIHFLSVLCFRNGQAPQGSLLRWGQLFPNSWGQF
jgi:hypothetical protein